MEKIRNFVTQVFARMARPDEISEKVPCWGEEPLDEGKPPQEMNGSEQKNKFPESYIHPPKGWM